ncbi:hypothetical protein [Membranihabitans marinus]|uniref:hypothetical protein n=1 Tax=Membranihabitans marinus TaxID=1227546 RepID=UPI001F3DDAFD|nr:hypothetical protein [Membranihabitans marinus]
MTIYFKNFIAIFIFLVSTVTLVAHSKTTTIALANKVTELAFHKKTNEAKLVIDSIPSNKFSPYPHSDIKTIESECDFAEISYDPFLEKSKKDLAYEKLFTYTPASLKPYFKSSSFLTAHGKLTSLTGGYKYFTLLVEIEGNKAKNIYGNIKKGSMMNIGLIKGKNLTLHNASESRGQYDESANKYIYKMVYPIDHRQEKILSKHPIDKIYIIWESGFESYEIYNVSFFQNQLQCLNNS